jgi:hypothetical protein
MFIVALTCLVAVAGASSLRGAAQDDSSGELPQWLPPCMQTDPPTCTFVAHNVDAAANCFVCEPVPMLLCNDATPTFELAALVFDCVPGTTWPSSVSPEMFGWYTQNCTDAKVYALIAGQQSPQANGWTNVTGHWSVRNSTHPSGADFLDAEHEFEGTFDHTEADDDHVDGDVKLSFRTSSMWANSISATVSDSRTFGTTFCSMAATTITTPWHK